MSIYGLFFAALLCGVASAHFQCRRRSIQHNPDAHTILNLTRLLTLEGLAFDYCKDDSCSLGNAVCGLSKSALGGGAVDGLLEGLDLGRRRRSPGLLDGLLGDDGLLGGLLGGSSSGGKSGGKSKGKGDKQNDGPLGGLGGLTDTVSDLVCHVGDLVGQLAKPVVETLQCIVDPDHDNKNPNKINPFQTCIIGSILELNLLDICDVQAIIKSLTTVCPKGDIHTLAVSACLCCTPEHESIDVCVNAALGTKGLKVDIKPANISILGLDKALGGDKGSNVVQTGDYVQQGKAGDGDGVLVNLFGPDGLRLGKEIRLLGSLSDDGNDKQQGGSGGKGCSSCENGGSGGNGGASGGKGGSSSGKGGSSSEKGGSSSGKGGSSSGKGGSSDGKSGSGSSASASASASAKASSS